MEQLTPKSFWEKPEGKTGTIVLAAAIVGGGVLLYKYIGHIVRLLENTVYAVVLGVALAAIVYLLLDPKFRNLMFYIYSSLMRFFTGLFVKIDPIGIIETYIGTLETNLVKMNTQIGNLRGQMRKLKDLVDGNVEAMKNNLALANEARERGKQTVMVLKTRKAGRLQDSNMRLSDLYKRMEILYRVLSKMHENSEALLEDIKDQVAIKKMEREAIRTSHSVMRSALNIIRGDKDKRMMFDQAMEVIADDVSRKVGEMERFMELSANVMDSIDLQNGVYEEKGLEMLEKWENEGISFLLGDDKQALINEGKNSTTMLDPDKYVATPTTRNNQYNDLFNF